MDKIQAVKVMQDYIRLHFADHGFEAADVCRAVGYSRRHGDRIFKELTGKTIQEYLSSVCLSKGADDLLKTEDSILDVALNCHFQSHEGFTRSFRRHFHISPGEYREKKIPIPLFVQYPVSNYEILLRHKEEKSMSDALNLCMIIPKERQKRKLIYILSREAEDYMSFCQEMGCEWEGLLNSIPEKIDTAALIELPDFLVEEGYSKVAAGVEVPLDYDKPLPDGYRTGELQACTMLYFQSEPYEKEEDFCKAIESAYKAVEKFNPEQYGYKMAYDIAPTFNFGAETKTGARLAVPVINKE